MYGRQKLATGSTRGGWRQCGRIRGDALCYNISPEALQRCLREHWQDLQKRNIRDGAVKDLHFIGHPILDENGKLVEYVGTAMDITDRKRAQQALQRSEAYLAEAERLSHIGSWAWRLADRKPMHLSAE
jgi:PAS domain-containing protein